jgi:hypothetical protein
MKVIVIALCLALACVAGCKKKEVAKTDAVQKPVSSAKVEVQKPVTSAKK